jgi:Phosphatidylserine/phosphatidylglycerophosphate/cardiolipin synthases and related enzymes
MFRRKIKEQTRLDKSIKKQELRQKSPSSVPEAPASPVAPIRTSEQEIAQLPELHHDLPREQLFQLYTTFIEKNDITGLFEYSLDFVTHGITSAQEINTLITHIVEKTPASPSPQLQVLRPTNYIFTNEHYDLLIGGLGHSLENELEQLIATEKTAIQISCYCLTNPRIARALIWAAQKRQVKVEILVDKSCQQAEAHVLDILAHHAVPVYISHDKERMHNKFALFHSRQTVWTGSANFTRAGLNQNHEIALICRVPEVFYQFSKYFNTIASKIEGYVQTIPIVGPATTATEAVLQPHFTNLKNIIINLIQAEKRNIAIASYMINDPAIIRALETALEHKPNLSVQIIVDSSAASNTHAFDMLLYNNLFTLKRYENASQELMHHKCMVFTSQQTVVLGSANLTEDALTDVNYENMVLIRDPQLATFCQTALIGQYLR